MSYKLGKEWKKKTQKKKLGKQPENDTRLAEIPYILESNPHPTLIRTSFCRFLNRKKES